MRPWTGIWVVRYAEVCQDVLASCSGVLTNGEFFIRTSLSEFNNFDLTIFHGHSLICDKDIKD